MKFENPARPARTSCLQPLQCKVLDSRNFLGYKFIMFSAGTGALLHAAVIMDGSGRWATLRGLPRSAGHRAGVRAVRRTVEAAPEMGLGALTLHAFSSDNWRRPPAESANLMQIFSDYLRADTEYWVRRGIRLNVIGRRDRLPASLCTTITEAELATQTCQNFHLRLAIDYSARDSIARAASCLSAAGEVSKETFGLTLAEAIHGGPAPPDVDLLIRTGGERRLSDFFLWECAYAELVFTPRLWPDFDAIDLEAALREFRSRERRFGRIPESVTV